MRARGKKGRQQLEAGYLDWALADFSGYIAADELYEGPYCVLSIVDSRNQKRLLYEVLDHSPTQDDVRAFFRRFQGILQQRALKLEGITTDGSDLYPAVIAEVFPGVSHQVCRFHVVKELTKAVLKAETAIRRELKRQMPKFGRGRPSKKQQKQRRKKERLERKLADLSSHRHLLVKRHLTPADRKILHRITRGLPQLRTLRVLMEEVYRLFDRRCRTSTALDKLAKLRRRVRRFQQLSKTLAKLFSPTLEKALTFLDEKLLASTSNAVERSFRRHRKMQKSVYRVRALPRLIARIALDLLRDMQACVRQAVLKSLHKARSGST